MFMKKFFLSLLFIGVISAVLTSSCKQKIIYEPSAFTIDEEEVGFKIYVEEADREAGMFIFTNCHDETVSYGDRNLLEKNIDGNWQSVVNYNQRELAEPSYELKQNERVEYETNWGGLLESGEYRYIVPFTVEASNNYELPVIHYSVAYFTI